MYEIEWCTIPFSVGGVYIEEAPGVTEGDPDSCYPAEGGYFEVDGIYYNSVDVIDLLPDSIIDRITEIVEEIIQGE